MRQAHSIRLHLVGLVLAVAVPVTLLAALAARSGEHAALPAALLAVLAVAVVIGLGAVLERRIVSPLAHLGDAAEQLAHGRLEARAVPPEAPAEIAAVLARFEAMAVTLAAVERSQRSVEERFRQVTAAIREVFGVIRTDLSEVLYVSPAYAEIWGRSAESLYADPASWLDAVLPEDQPRLRELLRQPPDGAAEVTFRIRRPDGEVRWIRSRSFPVRAAGGEVSALAGAAEDITEQLRSQETLRRAETMSALGSLVASVSHEVRNPLFSITATLDAFEARFAGQAGHQRYLSVLRGEVDRLTRLMQNLLDYGRPAGLLLAPESLADVIDAAISSCAPAAELAGVTFRNLVPRTLPPRLVDRGRIAQVMRNLLENAVQLGPRGGVVTVSSQGRPGAAEMLAIAVRDQGPGFDAGSIHRVFEPFHTRRRGGTGLGLAIAYRIVEQHGGTIEAENHPEGGAVVTVRLPGQRAEGATTP